MGKSIALIAMTANVGSSIASCIVYSLHETLGEERMMQWGWRLPFLLSIIPGAIALWGRRRMPESEVFVKEQLHTTTKQTDVESHDDHNKTVNMAHAEGA